MVVVMQEGAKEEQIQHVIDRLVSMGFDIHQVENLIGDMGVFGGHSACVTNINFAHLQKAAATR